MTEDQILSTLTNSPQATAYLSSQPGKLLRPGRLNKACTLALNDPDFPQTHKPEVMRYLSQSVPFSEMVGFKMNQEEKDWLTREALAHGMTRHAWGRKKLLSGM